MIAISIAAMHGFVLRTQCWRHIGAVCHREWCHHSRAGFGTYGVAVRYPGMIPVMLNAGLRHFEIAETDRNEAEIGEWVAASGLKCKDVFLTTKVWVANYPDRAFAASVDESLASSHRLRRPSAAALSERCTHSLSKSQRSTPPYAPARSRPSASATSTGR